MASSPRVVAELGRPETPDETAARKAESSRIYRSSQTFRNLVAALIATLAVVAVIIFAVPRGTPPESEPIDVAAVAERLAVAQDRTLVVADVPADWRVNLAAIEGDAVRAWTVVYVPGGAAGFLRVAQGFDADPAWATRVLRGASVAETVTIEGVAWERWSIPDSSRAGNVSAAIGTAAGADTILVYGTADDEDLETVAAALADQIRALQEAAP